MTRNAEIPTNRVPHATLELFYTHLECALLALHNNNLSAFKAVSARIMSQVPESIALKSNYLSWYTAHTLAWENRFEPALIQLEQAAEFKPSTPLLRTFKAKIVGDMGCVLVALGNFKEALKRFKQSILTCNWGEQAAVVYLNMGSLYLSTREFPLSFEAYQKALALSSSSLRLLIYSGLGQLAMEQRDFPMARRYLLTGYCLARSLTDDLHKGDIFCNLGKYYKEVMNYTSALRLLNLGLEYAQRSGMKRTALYILVEMADVYLLQNNLQAFEEIISEISTQVSDDGDYRLFGAHLIVMAKGHLHARRYAQALLSLETNYRFLANKGASQELLTTCLLLQKIHSREKNVQAAAFYGNEARRIKKLLR